LEFFVKDIKIRIESITQRRVTKSGI
jgi:hypothetical protein